MIDKADVQRYQQIKAPLELRERVLGARKKTVNNNFKKIYGTVASIAACFLLVFVCWGVFDHPSSAVTLTVNDFGVAQAAEMSVSRSVLPTTVNIDIESEGKIKVKCADDGFYLTDSETGDLKAFKETKVFKGNVSIAWDVSMNESVLTVNGKDYKISYLKDTNSVEINKID